ncbi:MAG: cupin domain-containing protein [Clostridiales bacterium]|nr:cupin domain-containing protein [Clostridiales bacterium]
MNDKLMECCIEKTDSLLLALKKIDLNKKGFVIVIQNGIFLGTLTDGDIRRALIRGKSIDDPIEDIYIHSDKVLAQSDGLAKAIDLMSNKKIQFLPVLGSEGKLVNILTKRQLQIVTLCKLQVDLYYDFNMLDESTLDYELTSKPWGYYKTTILNDFYQSKVLGLNPGSAISLQRHKLREEYWFIVFGQGQAQIGDSIVDLHAGSTVFIPKGCIHRLCNNSKENSLIAIEVQLGEGFDEDDIERLEDDYERT